MKNDKKTYDYFLISTRAILFICLMAYMTQSVHNQSSSSSPTSSSSTGTGSNSTFSGKTTRNCTVDKCELCVDNTSLTCATCMTGWYKKTYRGGNKSYDACWSIWKLVLLILGLLCLSCCCAACMMYCKRRGRRGFPCCFNIKDRLK